MTTTERVTVSLRRDLVEAVDKLELNRSRSVSQAVEHELERRSREALMQPVRNPHPVTRDLAESGLDAWLTNASTDDVAARRKRGHVGSLDRRNRMGVSTGLDLSMEAIDQGLRLFLGLGA